MKSENEISDILLKYYETFHKKDWKVFAEYLSENFIYFSDNITIMKKNSFVEFLKKDKWQGLEYKVYDINITLSENKDMAFASYKTSFTGLMDNKEMTISAIETTIFVKLNNEWKIVHSHTSNIMK